MERGAVQETWMDAHCPSVDEFAAQLSMHCRHRLAGMDHFDPAASKVISVRRTGVMLGGEKNERVVEDTRETIETSCKVDG